MSDIVLTLNALSATTLTELMMQIKSNKIHETFMKIATLKGIGSVLNSVLCKVAPDRWRDVFNLPFGKWRE
jgi:hypothetical protein